MGWTPLYRIVGEVKNPNNLHRELFYGSDFHREKLRDEFSRGTEGGCQHHLREGVNTIWLHQRGSKKLAKTDMLEVYLNKKSAKLSLTLAQPILFCGAIFVNEGKAWNFYFG